LPRFDAARIRAIGEDPEEFAKFRDGLRNAIHPKDDVEDFLASQMLETRWRQFRLLKAEAAILARGRCQFVIDRQRQLGGQGQHVKILSGVPDNPPSPPAGFEPAAGPSEPGGAAAGPQTRGARFAPLVKFLKTVRAAVKSEGFQGPSLKLLEGMSGPETSGRS
jgi:hypothetical protein